MAASVPGGPADAEPRHGPPPRRATESGAVVAGHATATTTRAAVAPDPTEAERLVAWQLVNQSRSCAVMGSPVYAFLLSTLAEDVLGGGPTAELLVPRVRPGRGDAAALRLMAALHRLVLTRQAPELALHYQSVGGTPDLRGASAAVLDAVAEHADTLAHDIERPCQTNEVARAAGLIVGLLDVAATTQLPLALREVGAAGGLNLRLDAFRYELPEGVVAGDPEGDVVLTDRWQAPVPHADADLRITDRRGCDPHPIDPTTADGRLTLSSAVWADRVDRFERLGAAIRTAERVPAVVDTASAAAWAREQLAATPAGAVRVVFHSIMAEYLPAAEHRDLMAAIDDAGVTATEDAPVAHVAMEPHDGVRHHAVSVRIWPHAPDERVVATTHAHGDWVTPTTA